MKYKAGLATVILLLAALMLVGCGSRPAQGEPEEQGVQGEQGESIPQYVSITAEEAKLLMDTEESYIIIDARTQEEYDEGHIPGAVLIPDYEIAARAEQELPDKEQLILVYCRSGRRSKIASQALAELGYKSVKEFGGIIDWPYETE